VPFFLLVYLLHPLYAVVVIGNKIRLSIGKGFYLRSVLEPGPGPTA